MKIDKYDAVVGKNGKIQYFAVQGKNRYPMPDCYKDMYDDQHLAIKEVEREIPSLFDGAPAKHYIPLRTS